MSTLKQGSIVKRSTKALLKRDPFDRPYAAQTVGVVHFIANGGYDAVVAWRYHDGRMARSVEDLSLLAEVS
jgi:hypothetical protein